MINREATWSMGESVLVYNPTTNIDVEWSFGESTALDEWVWREWFRVKKVMGVSISRKKINGITVKKIGGISI